MPSAPVQLRFSTPSAILRPILRLWNAPFSTIFLRVYRLTKQEQLVLCVVLGLLLAGWAVKAYRTAHPPTQAAETVAP